jgi:hypothetical protein
MSERNTLILVCICLCVLVYVLYVVNDLQKSGKATTAQVAALTAQNTTGLQALVASKADASDVQALRTAVTALQAAKPALYGTGAIDSFDKAGDFFPTPAQLINGAFIHSSQVNGNYSIKLPSASLMFDACGRTPNATFKFVLYPRYTVMLRSEDGGLLYGGTFGGSGGSGSGGFQTAQGSSALLLPNNAAYTFSFLLIDNQKYYVFVTQ